MDIAKIKKEYDELIEELSNPEIISQWEKFQELSKRRGSLEKILTKVKEVETLHHRIEENKQIIAAQEDPELAALAEQELKTLTAQEETLQKELENLQKEGSSESPNAIIIEIRAGTGGQEAALFARNLFDMYSKYAVTQKWKQTLIDMNQTDLNGIREASFVLEGNNVFEKLQHEAGVHRVQRIPTTEKSGRIHTSTASVAVLAKPKRAQLQVNPADLKTEFFNASGPGGQNVNKRQTAVRITHAPSGLVVTSQASRRQQQNKENALALLAAKLLQGKEEAEGEKVAGERKSQIGEAKRVEKIRTYNFPQDRITDHRTKQNWHGLEKILTGELDPLLADLNSELQE